VRHPEDAQTFGASERAFPVVLDVTDYAAVPKVVQKAEREAGPVDVLVNNAGYGHEGVLEESSMRRLNPIFI
jgi:NADP-dependent 3-hydroxy acid dehydrogenase YdfG